MIEILLIISLINFIIYKKTKKRPNAFFCGLWCYVGVERADPWKLRVLALYNQQRGDHATGVCIDNVIVKQTVNAREFLASNAELFNFDNFEYTNHAILGHCRQATASYARENQNFAHPHEVKKEETDEHPFIYGVHNGTITNIFDLASKYDLEHNSTKFSDSMMIFKMLAKVWDGKNVDPLKEYEGSATVIFYPRNTKNTLFIHRDKARELFYWQESETSCYISSVKDGLVAISGGEENVKEFEADILFKFYNGHITKKWELKDKKPYTKPRTVSQYSSRRPEVRQTIFPVRDCTLPNIQKKDGFYWDNHFIYHNGHLFTGQFYVNKVTGKGEKYASKADMNQFDEYYAIMGMVVKSLEAYRALFYTCVKDEQFSPELYKKIMPSTLQAYSKYPIPGKIVAKENAMFFWSEALLQLPMEDTYKWTPVLSNKIFEISRSGCLVSEVFIRPAFVEKPKTGDEAIKYLFELKANRNESYNKVYELFDDYKKARNFGVISAPSFDNFSTEVLNVLKEFNMVDKSEIDDCEKLREMEEEFSGGFGYSVTESYKFVDRLSQLIKTTCNGLRASRFFQETNDDTHIDYAIETLLDDKEMSEVEHYKSEPFLRDILFGTYENLDQIMTDYLLDTDNQESTRMLFYGIALGLKDIGLITPEDAENIKTLDISSVRFNLSRVYGDFKKDDGVKRVIVALENKNPTEAFANLFQSFDLLEKYPSRSKEQEIYRNLLELGLRFLASDTKFNKRELLSQHNITSTEIDNLCQPA